MVFYNDWNNNNNNAGYNYKAYLKTSKIIYTFFFVYKLKYCVWWKTSTVITSEVYFNEKWLHPYFKKLWLYFVVMIIITIRKYMYITFYESFEGFEK